jgi:Hemerythrin HHE cation binding domain
MEDTTDTATVTAPSTQDALALLTADHRHIDALFDDLARLEQGSNADRSGLLGRLAVHLRVHETVEREIFYPALEGLIAKDELTTAALDHQRIDARLDAVASSGEPSAAALAELQRTLREHVRYEERVLFAAARSVDLSSLGTRMALRRATLLGGDVGAD